MIFQDPRLRLTLFTTLVMSVIIFVLTQERSAEEATPLVLVLVVLMSLLQMSILFLWSGSPRSQLNTARQHFMAGEFEKTIAMLEPMVQEHPDAATLALLGNAYRQRAAIAKSKAALQQAVELEPNNKLALFGLGKTLLIEGQYTSAVDYIQQALDNDGRKTIRAELAQALYYAGRNPEEVIIAAQQASRVLNLEQHRTLFINYLLYNLADHEKELAERLIRNHAEGLAYWEAEARRFAQYDYGRRIAGDVVQLRAILNKEKTSND